MEKQPECAISSVEKASSQAIKQVTSARSSSVRKKIKYHITTVRRSNRIQKTIVNAENQNIQPVIQEINVTENDKEDEQDASMEEELPNSPSGEKSMEEKMDYISNLLEAHGKNMEKLMAKVLVEVTFMY